jgi:hypothetical protein
MSISNYAENKMLDAVLNNVSLVVAQAYVKLHIADPGEDGTASAAAETARKALSVGAAAAGVCTSDADLNWPTVAASETYSHVSLWDSVGPAGGNCLWTGGLTTPKAVTAGDTFTIPTGQLTVSLD